MNVTCAEIAERLDIPLPHVNSWAVAWHGPQGSGRLRPLDLVDLYVARAWFEIGGAWAGWGRYYGRANPRQRLAEVAIRANPRRWLLLAGERLAETHDTAEAAARAWLASGVPAATVIDLWSVPA